MSPTLQGKSHRSNAGCRGPGQSTTLPISLVTIPPLTFDRPWTNYHLPVFPSSRPITNSKGFARSTGSCHRHMTFQEVPSRISKRPFTSGSFSDLYRGTYNGSQVCVKELRVSSDSNSKKAAKGDTRCHSCKLCIIF